jgi:hypothetical protein
MFSLFCNLDGTVMIDTVPVMCAVRRDGSTHTGIHRHLAGDITISFDCKRLPVMLAFWGGRQLDVPVSCVSMAIML